MKKKKAEKRLLTDIKIFLKKKKSLSIIVNVIRIFLNEQKEKQVEHMRNYDLAHKK